MYWFSKKDRIYKTDSDIMQETQLTENELRTAKQKIKKLSFIKVTREGIPAKTFYTINWESYESSLVDYSETSTVKLTNTDSLNPQNCDSGINGTITESTTQSTTKNTNKRDSTPSKKFTPPTLMKVSEYMQEQEFKNIPDEAMKFIDHYESVGWLVGKTKMKCWKAAVRQWKRRINYFKPKYEQQSFLDESATVKINGGNFKIG